jgi:hypothetical protein
MWALRSLAVWCAFIAIETVLGTLRVLLVEPRLGTQPAKLIAFPIGCTVILATVWWASPWMGLRSSWERFAVGLLWAGLTFGFELAMGALQGMSAGQALADYDLRRGGLMALGLMMLLVAPWMRR